MINAAQQMLKQRCVAGLQDVTLANTLSLEAQVSEEFVQILNVGESHWITVSNVGCGPGRVKVFDSGGKYFTHRNREEIATILLTEENTITVEFMNVQHQFGAIDCGLFANL